jgi:hypothetical protein
MWMIIDTWGLGLDLYMILNNGYYISFLLLPIWLIFTICVFLDILYETDQD